MLVSLFSFVWKNYEACSSQIWAYDDWVSLSGISTRPCKDDRLRRVLDANVENVALVSAIFIVLSMDESFAVTLVWYLFFCYVIAISQRLIDYSNYIYVTKINLFKHF